MLLPELNDIMPLSANIRQEHKQAIKEEKREKRKEKMPKQLKKKLVSSTSRKKH